MSKRVRAIIESILSIVIFVLIWKIASATGIFGRVSVKSSELLLPPPEKVVTSMYDLFASGYIGKHILVSFWRVIRGFGLAVAIGVPVGILMGISRDAKNLLNLIFRLFSLIPGVAWVPLALLWFGIGDSAAIVINTMQGVKDVDPNLQQALQTMGASKWQQIIHCIIPCIIPHMISGFRLGLGFAWRVVIAAELVGVPDGIGYVLNVGRSTGHTEITIVTILLLGIIMILMEEVIFVTLERRLSHWKGDKS